MTLDEAIKVLRQHNEKGASVLRITRGQGLEKDLLAQVLDSCEQLISEKAEYKRLLKVAVGDINFAYFCFHAACKNVKCEVRCPYYNKNTKACSMVWRYADEAEKLLNDKK